MKPVRYVLGCVVALGFSAAASASQYGERSPIRAFSNSEFLRSDTCICASTRVKVFSRLQSVPTAHVPEPATWLLLIVGAGLIAGRRLQMQPSPTK